MFVKNGIFLLGPPGVGKGTLSAILERVLRCYHLSSSGLASGWIESHPDDLKCIEQKEVMERGGVFNSEWILEILLKEMERVLVEENHPGIILDGPPRVECEALPVYNALARLVGEENIYVVDIMASEEVIISRARQRLVCPQNRKHVVSAQDGFVEGSACPHCKSPDNRLEIRPEDKNMQERLRVYKETVKLAHGRVKELNKGFISVDTTNSSPHEVAEVILETLNLP